MGVGVVVVGGGGGGGGRGGSYDRIRGGRRDVQSVMFRGSSAESEKTFRFRQGHIVTHNYDIQLSCSARTT